MTKKPMSEKGFGMKVLNGVAVGSVVVLIPGALLNELFKALLPVFPQGQFVLNATALAMTLMAAVVGFAISMQFKFTPIETAAVAMASVMGSGGWAFAEGGGFLFKGSGDIINMSITAAVAAAMIIIIGGRFKAYTLLLTPSIVLIVAGAILIDDALVDYLLHKSDVQHPANLAAAIAHRITQINQKGIAYVYDPISVDQMNDVARISG